MEIANLLNRKLQLVQPMPSAKFALGLQLRSSSPESVTWNRNEATECARLERQTGVGLALSDRQAVDEGQH
jgi:hypothetical protein